MSSKLTCVYCGGLGPFNAEEHVFPAGLGGDDRRYILRNTVCDDCNNKIFSPMEREFMRNSPTGLSRIFSQSTGRKKVKKPVKLDTHSTTVGDASGQLRFEAEMLPKGNARVFPQVILAGNELRATGGDGQQLKAFIEKLVKLFSKTEITVFAAPIERGGTFSWRTCMWDGTGKCVISVPVPQGAPPAQGIKVARPRLFENQSERGDPPRIYLDPRGELLCRFSGESELIELLTILHRYRDELASSAIGQSSVIDNPSMTMEMSMDVDKYARVYAKIGVNMAIHAFGEQYVRHSAFNDVKTTILEGTRDLDIRMDPEVAEMIAPLLASVPEHLHVVALTITPTPDKACDLVAFFRLYGIAETMIRLAHNIPASPRDWALYTVDYQNHVIEDFDLLSFAKRYPPAIPRIKRQGLGN